MAPTGPNNDLPAPVAKFTLYNKELGKAQTAFGKDLDPNGSGADIQSNRKRLSAAERLRALVTNPDGSIKDMIPPQFMKETAAALAGLVTAGGVPAQALIEELSAKTKSSKLADWMQWLTDKPQDAGQGAFVKLYLESAEREAGVARKLLDDALRGRAGKHQRLIFGNPEEARFTARQQGFDITDSGDLVPMEGEHREGKSAEASGPVKVTTLEAKNALPSGTRYVGPDGVERVKK
jgi:hypothetical protein